MNSIMASKRFRIAISTLLRRVALPFPSRPSRRKEHAAPRPAQLVVWPQATVLLHHFDLRVCSEPQIQLAALFPAPSLSLSLV